MQILFLVLLVVLLIICVLFGIVIIVDHKILQRITVHIGMAPEISDNKKIEAEAQLQKAESDEAFTNMLVELSEEKKARDNAPFGTYSFDELDAFDELKNTETDPEKLLKILEYGLPDEELEEIIKKIESGK